MFLGVAFNLYFVFLLLSAAFGVAADSEIKALARFGECDFPVALNRFIVRLISIFSVNFGQTTEHDVWNYLRARCNFPPVDIDGPSSNYEKNRCLESLGSTSHPIFTRNYFFVDYPDQFFVRRFAAAV